MKLHIYWIHPVMRNFGLHHHGVVTPPDKVKRCHNLHLWFFGIGFYREKELTLMVRGDVGTSQLEVR